MPNVSSNLVIDASTQPGLNFGISSAKIKISTEFPFQETYYGFALREVRDIEIYGFYIHNPLAYNPMGKRTYWQAISIKNCTNIRIGAAGKGNVIAGFYENIGFNIPETSSSYYYSENITIQDNFIGVEADGFTIPQNEQRALQANYLYGKVIFGGKEKEGNLIPAGFVLYQANTSESTNPRDRGYTLPADVTIANNKIGVDYNITQGYSFSRGIWLATITPNGKSTIILEDNVVSSTQTYGIQVSNIGKLVTLRRNYIGTDRTLTKKLPVGGVGIFVYYADQVLIGGDDPTDANYIAYCKPVMVWPYSVVAVKKNSFFCTVNAYPMIELETYRPITKISLDMANATQVKGTATPNSIIELFYNDKCGTCSPQTYFASTTTDANGNWEYKGNITGAVIASATYNNSTSEFTRTVIDISKTYTVSTCGNTGSILGALPKTSAPVQWVDIEGRVVGTQSDLRNVPPGKYKLQVIGIDCPVETGYFEVKKNIVIDASNVIITNPSCGKANGSLRGLVVSNYSSDRWKLSWKNELGQDITQAFDLDNIKPGIYTFTASLENNTCAVTYGPIKFINIGGVEIDEKSAVITSTNCGNKDGSVKGIVINSDVPPLYNWKNSEGKIVSYAKDLINQPAGNYFLEVSNSGNCGTVISSIFTIPELNGITISDIGIIHPSSCSNQNGSITGIKISGATSFGWYDSQNNFVSKKSSPDLENVLSGSYYLVAGNEYCTRRTKVYTIPNLQNNTNYGVPVVQIKNAKCGNANGSIQVTFLVPVYSYRWINKERNLQLSEKSSSIQNLVAATYSLYLSDQNGCEKFYSDYTVLLEPEIILNDTHALITNDFCGLGLGSIYGISFTGKPPFSFQWIDDKGKVLSQVENISGLRAGIYKLKVKDFVDCEKTYSYSITEHPKVISLPNVNGLQICAPGEVVLIVNNVSSEFSYRLYDDLGDSSILMEEKSGRFNINVTQNRSYYVTQFKGDCESEKMEVKVTVGFNLYNIPNTISPNGDGINDTWVLKNIESYPNVSVKIFNRNGNKVFESQKYQYPFDGKINGVELPAGIYYYQIKVSNNCSPISGSLTILR
ncbi:gliding motility-associated C-terminal domain-containing protein [Pedobacter sp. Leaf250]|uniref:gliding motility-associated C-terminal domain-containing protein n=1 Tax=Pedobacter sp. Leaf250 TaxID=2876559 RepID=UPI001E5E5B2D|nr:gliding motility-associated C-terminal domain-containing protein [Pedobacter sp. Leaf250]